MLQILYCTFNFEGHHSFLQSLSKGGSRNECCNLNFDHLMSLVFTNSFDSNFTQTGTLNSVNYCECHWLYLKILNILNVLNLNSHALPLCDELHKSSFTGEKKKVRTTELEITLPTPPKKGYVSRSNGGSCNSDK